MLKVFNKHYQIEMGKLLKVYSQGHCEITRDQYPQLEPGLALLNAEQDFITYLSDAFFLTPGAIYAVWEVSDMYLSALRLEPYKDGLLVEALETHPDFRNRGFGKALLRSALDYCCSQKAVPIYSHIKKNNIASLRTHVACGFTKILDYAVYIDGSVGNDSWTLCYAENEETRMA